MTSPLTHARPHRRLAAVSVVLLALVGSALAGCGGDDDSSSADDSGVTTTSAATDEGTTDDTAPGDGDGDADAAGTETLEILVTNDDGYDADGIDAVAEALAALEGAEVVVVAPLEQQSGRGGTFTDGPVASAEAETASGRPVTTVDGFPADAVRVALEEMGLEPDLVVSGINEGQNVGPLVDVSGTVGAARAGAAGGVPSLAVSSGLPIPSDYDAAIPFVVDWVEESLDALLAEEAPVEVASINVPTCTAGEIRGLAEVDPGTSGNPLDPQDCTSTLEDPVDDLQAFVNGFATLSVVPDEPDTPPEAVDPDAVEE